MQIMFSDVPGAKVVFQAIPYEVETDGNTTYTRYTDGKHLTNLRAKTFEVEKQLIFRKTVDGNIVRNEKAYDLWENRKTAKYIPVNSATDMFTTVVQ